MHAQDRIKEKFQLVSLAGNLFNWPEMISVVIWCFTNKTELNKVEEEDNIYRTGGGRLVCVYLSLCVSGGCRPSDLLLQVAPCRED